jgi:hypothetical protein
MAGALAIRPRASIDDARPVLFYGNDEPQQSPIVNLKPAMDGITQREARPTLRTPREPGLPENGLPGATSVDGGGGLDAIGGAMRTPPFVEKRTVRERPRISLGDVLPQRGPTEPMPQYQQKTEFGFWDRVKAALGGARYNAGGGLLGMIGGAIGGAVHPEMIADADFATGPMAAWRRRRQMADQESERADGQAMKRLQMAKIISEIEKNSEQAGLKPLPNSPYLAFYDEKTGEIVMPRVGGEPLPGAQLKLAERNHDLDMIKLREKEKLDLEELTRRQEFELRSLGLKGASAKEIEAMKQKNRLQVESLKQGHQRQRDSMLEAGRNKRHTESMTRPTLTLPMLPSRRDEDEEDN